MEPITAFASLLPGLATCLVLAFVVSGTSITITQTDIFEPLRNFLAAASPWLGKLIQCFYCTSHWIAFPVVAIYRPVLIHSGVRVIDYAVSAFFIVNAAMYFTGIGYKSFSVIGTTKRAMEEAKALAKAKEGVSVAPSK